MVRLATASGSILQPLEASDADALHALWTSPGVRRFLWDGEVIPPERTRAIVDTSAELFATRGAGLWSLRRPGAAALVGVAGFWPFRQPPELELLYAIAESEWGRGHATGAARAVMGYGYGTLGMPFIRASTDAANVASSRVLEKLGFELVERATVGGLDTLFYRRAAGGPVPG